MSVMTGSFVAPVASREIVSFCAEGAAPIMDVPEGRMLVITGVYADVPGETAYLTVGNRKVPLPRSGSISFPGGVGILCKGPVKVALSAPSGSRLVGAGYLAALRNPAGSAEQV
jgi:hypothetical protein